MCLVNQLQVVRPGQVEEPFGLILVSENTSKTFGVEMTV